MRLSCKYIMIALLLILPLVGFAQGDDCFMPVSVNVNSVTCPGLPNGNATVSTPECECMSSGCTFEWSDGQEFHTAINLPAGTYTVTITHPSGCFTDTTVVIEEPPHFIDYIDINDVSCFGQSDGSVAITPTLNAGPLTYSWPNTSLNSGYVNNLEAGNYNVTITNLAGCDVVEQVVVEEADDISIDFIVNDACQDDANGDIFVFPNGGSPPYQYQWNGPGVNSTEENLSGISSGTYNLIVSDQNGCAKSVEQEVGFIESSLFAFAADETICLGTNTMLVATGGLSYNWAPQTGLSATDIANPFANPTETTTYTVTCSDLSGCDVSETVTVHVETIQAPQINVGSETICKGDATFLSAIYFSGAETTYQWEPTTGISNPNSKNTNVNPNETTTYTVTVTTPEGCQSSTDVTITVEDCENPTTTIETSSSNLVNLFPNPSNGLVNLQIPKVFQNGQLSIYNASGQFIKQEVINAQNQTIDLSSYSKGVYIIELLNNSDIYTEKVLIY